MARRRRADPFLSQAQAEAFVRYNPEVSALAELLRQARQTATTGIASARSSGAHVRQTIAAARPQIGRSYRTAQRVATAQAGVAAADLAGLPADSPLRAAAQLEQTGLTGRLAESRANAETALTQQSVGSRQGQAAAVQAARSKLASDLTSIYDRRIQIAREQGVYTASEAARLQTEAAKQAQALAIAAGRDQTTLKATRIRTRQEERNSLRSAGIDPKTGKPIPGGKLDPAAQRRARLKPAPAEVTTAVGKAQHWANFFKSQGVSRQHAEQTLTTGAPAQKTPIYKTVQTKNAAGQVTGTKQVRALNPDGTPKYRQASAVPSVDDELLLRAGIELAYDGYISKHTRDALNRRGLDASSIGTVYWQSAGRRAMARNRRERVRRRPHAPGTTGVVRGPAGQGPRPG